MRHRKSGRKLGRNSSHRTALFNNLVTALLTHGRIETTEAKAKELRKFAEAAITWSVDVHPLIAKGDAATPAEKAKLVHARRRARLTVMTDEAMQRLFGDIATHFAAGKGGYTRVLKTRVRKGDAAPMAYIELCGLAVRPA
ncbi:MAG: 50S ribosomal protein L17 [Proteobacteria bacterium]|nr:50S ribosomal protein L17 [Pseudomonadota bacterium]